MAEGIGSTMDKLYVRKITCFATVPTKGSPDSAGYDLYSAYDYIIEPWRRTTVQTDLQIVVPNGTYGRIVSRSGLCVRYGLHVGAGVIDPDYRGNVGVVLFNFGNQSYNIKKGERIAQLVCEKIKLPEIEVVQSLTETIRGADGFGSTGM